MPDPQPTFDFPRFAPPFLDDPYPLYRSAPPVFLEPALGLWFITRHELIRSALKQPDLFSSQFLIRTPASVPAEVQAILDQGYPEEHVLFNQDPPGHTRLRRLVGPAFGPRRMAALEAPIQRIVDEALDALAGQEKEGADLCPALTVALPMQVICSLIGLPLEDAPSIKQWSADLMLLNGYSSSPEQLLQGARSALAFQQHLDRQIEDHLASPRDDLLTDLLEAQAEGVAPLSRSELINLIITVVFAGHETTTNLIGNVLRAVLADSALRKRLADHPELADAVIEETLRFDPPVQAMFRTAARPAAMNGATIPAGASVVLLFGAANRDPAVFADPDRFDPDRPGNGQHLGLGHGIHYCIGSALALAEARIALQSFIRRFPDAHLDERRGISYAPNLIHRGPLQLHARLTRRA